MQKMPLEFYNNTLINLLFSTLNQIQSSKLQS
jgi:hypothetical protein